MEKCNSTSANTNSLPMIYLSVMGRVDHGDRSGGLLIGYVGLITVPVAYN